MEIRKSDHDPFEGGSLAEIAYLNAPVGLVVTENRVIRDCNTAFAEMFGYTRAELRDQFPQPRRSRWRGLCGQGWTNVPRQRGQRNAGDDRKEYAETVSMAHHSTLTK